MRWLIPFKSLTILERFGLILLLVAAIAFGILVEIRGAFLRTRHSDLAVFARAAWAVRSDADLYQVTDDKGLHYHYPPLLAILMTPVADPPPGATLAGQLPFALTVALWYVLSVVLGFWCLHLLANACADATPVLAKVIGERWSRRWWHIRIVPLLICFPYFGHALVLGQINVLWMAALCWSIATLLKGQRFQTGLWLSVAMCVKVVPAFLLVYPLWRRDGRCLAGIVLGLALGMGVIPAVALGPQRAWTETRTWVDAVVLPAFGMGSDHARDKEFMGVWSNHNQALAPVIHKTLHIRSEPKPEEVAPAVTILGYVLGGLFTVSTLWAAGWRRPNDRLVDAIFLGCLNVNMIVVSPGGHPHYLLLLVPLILLIFAGAWEAGQGIYLNPTLCVIMGLNLVASATPLIVQRDGICYDLGMPMYAALSIMLVGCREMSRRRRVGVEAERRRDPSLDGAIVVPGPRMVA
jgi:Glycosyltransferase family 87